MLLHSTPCQMLHSAFLRIPHFHLDWSPPGGAMEDWLTLVQLTAELAGTMGEARLVL